MSSSSVKSAPTRFGIAPQVVSPSREAAARLMVSAWFQQAVDDGIAVWRLQYNGACEVHFRTGEAFLLEEAGITRIVRPAPRELQS